MNWEKIKQEWETSNITFKELADKYNIKASTIRSRKNREKWQRNATKKNATQRKDVATLNKRKVQTNRSGNPNPVCKFPKRNRAAVKHGFFSKYIPKDSLDIMNELQDDSPIDMLWNQIIIQYAAIIRAQKIMYVENKNEIIKELKKEKETDHGIEREYEFQFAWDRQATFLNAQSRAMSELRSLIKQFNETAHEDDERKMKLKQMQLGINKTQAETEFIQERTKLIKGEEKDTGLLEALIEGRKTYEQSKN